jgi:hypothetical protein
MKALLLLPLLFLTSCGLLFEPSKEAVQAQQTAYIGVTKLEQNYALLLDEYEAKLKALITYVYTFSMSKEVEIARENGATEFELDQIRQSFMLPMAEDLRKVDENLARWRKVGDSGHNSAKALIEAVYEYMTTTSVSVAEIGELIDNSLRTWDQIKDN